MQGYLFYVIPWDITTSWSTARVGNGKPADE
jgi:hypothetical protein